MAWSQRAPESAPWRAWWHCLDHHDPTVQQRAASQLVDAASDRERRHSLVRRLLAMHPSVSRAALTRSLAWPSAQHWVPALDQKVLESVARIHGHLAGIIGVILGVDTPPWTPEERQAVAAAVRSPFFASWQPPAVSSLLGRLCTGTDPDRGLLAAVVDALPEMAEAQLRASLAAVPMLVAREPAAVARPAGDRFRATFLERMRANQKVDLFTCSRELARAWAAIELPPGTPASRCQRALYDKVPAVRLARRRVAR